MSQKPVAKVQLNVSCHNLLNRDVLSKSDPQVFLFMKLGTNPWFQYGKSEVVWDNLNPKFKNPFEVDYFFEEVQHLRFVVVDVDSGEGNGKIEDQDFLGQIEIQLSKIFTSRGQTVECDLMDSQNQVTGNRGKIKIIAEEMREINREIVFEFAAVQLDKKDFFGKSDPYFVISRSRENGDWVVVHKSEVIQNTLDPTWRAATLKLRDLNNGEMDRLLLIQVFDWNRVQEHELIGEFTASLNDIISKKPNDFLLINPAAKAKKRNYVKSGIFRLKNYQFFERPTFLDYVAAGLDINLAVAIDFTQSNGDPKLPSSLHYMNPHAPNPYQQAIMGVGAILEAYDSDKQFPVFGFGAKFPDGTVSHCFPLNGNPYNPEVVGVNGILGSYNQSISVLQLWGPTNFSPILRATQSVVEASLTTGSVKYFILLIITDGVITDIDATIRAIVEISHLPLSIVIVGVGNADFSNMEVLDGDKVPLTFNGKRCARDIVQFVPFNQCPDPHALARETLAEIPLQLTQYMMANKLLPEHVKRVSLI